MNKAYIPGPRSILECGDAEMNILKIKKNKPSFQNVYVHRISVTSSAHLIFGENPIY